MTFTKVDQEKSNGTSYQGLIKKTTYSELCRIFGKPNGPSEDGKVQVQWTIEIAGSVIATIYDWKEEVDSRSLNYWHVGGTTKDVIQLIEIILKEYRKNNK